MRIRNNNQLDLQAKEGERLTLSFENTGGTAEISIDAPAATDQRLPPGRVHQFAVPKGVGSKSLCFVTVTCTFKTNGMCVVKLTDPAGLSARHEFTSAFGLESDSVTYTINVDSASAAGAVV